MRVRHPFTGDVRTVFPVKDSPGAYPSVAMMLGQETPASLFIEAADFVRHYAGGSEYSRVNLRVMARRLEDHLIEWAVAREHYRQNRPPADERSEK